MQRVESDNWSSREVARLLSLVENERSYFQEMMSVLPVGVAVVNRELSLMSSNRVFRQVFGLRAEAAAETTLHQLAIQGVGGAAREVIESGVRRTAFSAAVQTPGGPRALRIHLSRFRDWDERSNGEALVVVEDLTEPIGKLRKEAQSSAAQAKDQLARVPALVWEADLSEGRFVAVNTEVSGQFGLVAESWMPGADFWGNRVFPPEREGLKAAYREAMADPVRGGNFSCDYRASGIDGRVRWLRDFVRLRDKRASGITVDITWCHLRDGASAQAAKVDALTRLSGRVVHDCNNMLMITSGYGEELLHALPEGDPLRANAQQILSASERLASMTRSLSSYVKHPSPEQQSFSIQTLIGELRDELRQSVPEPVELLVQGAASPMMVDGDPGLIAHTIRTLVQRAAASMTGAGWISIETTIAHSNARTAAGVPFVAPGPYAQVVVRDNGHAIHPDMLAHLFEPQIATDLESYGLPALYKSVREMGGELLAESEFAKGTAFTLLLRGTNAPGEPVAPAPPEPAEARVETVLIVEDEAGIRTLMRRILDREGYTLLEAGHGKAALEVARNHPGPIDLLVTDVVMPEMSGFELAREIRSFRDNLKVLFISGYTGLSGVDPEQMKEGSAFLQKPFTLNAFVAKVRELLEKRVP